MSDLKRLDGYAGTPPQMRNPNNRLAPKKACREDRDRLCSILPDVREKIRWDHPSDDGAFVTGPDAGAQ